MATTAQIIEQVSSRFGSAITAMPDPLHARIEVPAEHWLTVATFLHDEPSIRLDWLRCLTAIDYAADGILAVAYDLWSFEHRHDLAVKVRVARDVATLPSVSRLWATADWHEREAFDLVGVTFNGHPNLQRILLADDWVGHPLRKDYVFPREYHGIPGSVELDWTQG